MSDTKPIAFANRQASGLEELAGGSPLAMNIVVDQLGAVYRRPGMMAHPSLTSAVIDASGFSGIYKTFDGRVWAVGAGGAERPIYLVGPGGAAKLGGGAPPNGLTGTSRPIFAETEMLLVIAGGADPEKVLLQGLPLSNRLGGVTFYATHVLANAQRLLLNDVSNDKTKVRYSDVAQGLITYAGHEVWSLGGVGTSGYITAEGRPDPVVALGEDTNEVLVFGQSTLQGFQPDPQTTYAPLATREVGDSAPYSVTKIDQDFYWLDHLRRFVQGSPRNYDVISDPIQRTIDGMGVTSDCWGAYLALDFLDTLLWTFPTDGRTFVYQKGAGWGQWSGSDDNNWAPLGLGAVYMPTDGTDPLIATTSGRVGTFSLDAATDFGTPIVASVTTGFESRGTERRKKCEAVRLTLRRGETLDTVGPQAFLRYRNDLGPWSSPIPVSLGASGEREVVVPLRTLGVYRRRQWKFEYSGTEALVLVAAEEEFTILPS